ncbi:acyl-CoA thioesterase [Psychrobacter sp. DM4]|uniref:acyl-CoA thioesterase n=1 Tax=Psychrobacter sp. DM4 TaxID=3440637 RepID=UPI003F4F68F9
MPDYAKLIDELLETVALTEVSPDVFEGKSHDYVGSRIFGGQVLAQAIMAAAHTLGEDKPCHSLHGYFLRGGDINQSVIYQVRRLRDGRSLSAREVTAIQYKEVKGRPPVEQVIFSMIASFSPTEEGLEYQEDMPIYPPPEDLVTEQELKEDYVEKVPEALRARFMRRRHVELKPVKPRDPINPEPSKPKQAHWIRIYELGKQPLAIQQALLAFSSDFYLVGTGLMSHGVSFVTKGLQAASIDHSMHFHRPFDLNDWLLYDMWSDTTSNGMGLNHGQFWQDGKLVATVQQEGLMRLRPPKS